MNDSKNRFSRNAEKQAKVDPAIREMPLSQRMTRFRSGEAKPDQPEGTAWSRRSAELEKQKPTIVEKAPVTRTQGGVVENPELKAAREAEKARREAAKQQAAGLAQTVQFVPEDFQATMSGWLFINSRENGGDFELTPFNAENLTRCVYYQVMSGQEGFTRFGISQLDACHKWLRENGFYESRTQKRGVAAFGSAAKEYPVYEPEEKNEPVATGSRPVFVRRDTAGDADVRKMSFDELQQNARKSWKPDTSRKVTGI
jgi:hypothetical protein